MRNVIVLTLMILSLTCVESYAGGRKNTANHYKSKCCPYNRQHYKYGTGSFFDQLFRKNGFEKMKAQVRSQKRNGIVGESVAPRPQ